MLASFLQVVAGLRISGLEEDSHHLLNLLHGVFTLDEADPEANGRPHYSTAAGGHLSYSTDGRWLLTVDRPFTPDSATCAAYIVAGGGVPEGKAVWRVHDGVAWADRILTDLLHCQYLSRRHLRSQMSTADADALETLL